MGELKVKIIEIVLKIKDSEGRNLEMKASSDKKDIKTFLWTLVGIYYNFYKGCKMSKNSPEPEITFITEDKNKPN